MYCFTETVSYLPSCLGPASNSFSQIRALYALTSYACSMTTTLW
jgi:hypothetical protein